MASTADGAKIRWKTRFDVLATFYAPNGTAPAIHTVSIHQFRSDGLLKVPALDGPGLMPARMATCSVVFLFPQADQELTVHFPVPDLSFIVNGSLPQLDKKLVAMENRFRGPLLIFQTKAGRYDDVDDTALGYVHWAAYLYVYFRSDRSPYVILKPSLDSITRFGCNTPDGPIVVGPPGPGHIKGAPK
ncbi:hypothetical protein C8Q80DRAFT_1122122 [Daedaleopsis nitida]|nr:hypothetical protein C8Q80DRAFT_1122122 [Daedaleopsis nitida]